ncbi:Ldh family oxidoreductase [Salipiger sp. PrR002]|uniref:Ldh family oxidoreductase n=1 Tax=Salipiger sp. PrR002 TaxID=2706489 RepID=UPI0013B81745|nr:Ldh family oxidoreductase [Salipiger sp. PrR002]NDV99297.1 Ldh family oxidoreductase [Salipiger sp. PrR002]NDW55783.1 Ldh family oxidoreductase [Salipiger sp. PrR004]
MSQTFDRTALYTLARSLLEQGGLPADKAATVAELLIQTDEIGVTTHGISMVSYYLPELAKDLMTKEGSHEVLADNKVTLLWDGNYLPGHWVMRHALDTCMARAAEYGMAAMAIRRSHHIGCLSALTRIAAEKGYVCYIATSDPSGEWVAPYGGCEPLLTPNPWAVGYPGRDHPVLIDTCASITTLSKVREHINSGTEFAHPWMLDGAGSATTDPTVINQSPKGSILPVGGADHGHKGFAMGLMVEMLTQALAGHGRVEAPTRWGANVFLQVIDPEAFGGREAFVAQVEHLNEACRNSRPIDPARPVRIPGDRAASAAARARTEGVTLPGEVLTRIRACAAEAGLAFPEPL